MNFSTKLIVALIVLFVLASGCTQKVSHLKFASTNNVDVTKKYALAATDVSAKTSGFFFLIFGSMQDMSYYRSLGHCLSDHDGDILTDVEVTTTSIYFLLGIYVDYKVRGNVWKRVDDVGLSSYRPEDLFELRIIDGEQQLVSQDGETVHKVFYQNS